MSHQCPRCGSDTDGAYSLGGLKWAICEDCMKKEISDQDADREMDIDPYYQESTGKIIGNK